MRTYAFDLETTNLKSDLGELKVACFGELNSEGEIVKILTRDTLEMHGEKNLVQWVLHRVEEADILIGQNSDAFDKNFLNGVLIRHGLRKLPKRIHIDTMLTARYGMKGLLSSCSMKNLVDYFNIPVKKMEMTKEDVRGLQNNDPKAIKRWRQRCSLDVQITALLWERLKPFYMDWRGK